jgi:hypothetical protein
MGSHHRGEQSCRTRSEPADRCGDCTVSAGQAQGEFSLIEAILPQLMSMPLLLHGLCALAVLGLGYCDLANQV